MNLWRALADSTERKAALGPVRDSIGHVLQPFSPQVTGKTICQKGNIGMSVEIAKDSRLDRLHADMCKVFTNPARIRILNQLREGETSVGDLGAALGLAQPTVSKHLIAMRDRAVLTSRKEGSMVYYRVANPKVLRAFDLIRQALVESLWEGARVAGGGRRR